MPKINIIAETNENTVVTEYEPIKVRSEQYQSERELEEEFISMLCNQGYEYVKIHTEKELIDNLKIQLEELNNYRFSETEWDSFFKNCIANPNEDIIDKTRKIQENNIQVLKCDDGLSKNIKLIDKENIHNNKLQVINQYSIKKDDGAKYDNRYDVTVLVNGLPLVHIELKRRGVAIREAFNQINRYQRESFWAGFGLYKYVQIFVISNGTNTKYYSNSTRVNVIKELETSKSKKSKTSNSFEFTSFWADSKNRVISDLIDFTKTFFAKNSILNILTKYCILTSENILLVMRPYQITATEQIISRIIIANNNKLYGTIKSGGYIWHTTGSGKTLTSFKTARKATELPFIDKVLFVVDRKDLDYQTMKEYDRFEKGSANGNTSTSILKKQLEDINSKIIITTIQKLSIFIKNNKNHPIYNKHTVIIFDECHRSQFGEMHFNITKNFKNYYIFGFTGTPIFPANSNKKNPKFCTTEQIFGDRLHSYTIIDAINDKNVLKFRVKYINTIKEAKYIEDEKVHSIECKEVLESPERIKKITEYILNNFNKETYRGDKTYLLNDKRRVSGFNSIFAVSSVSMAKLYYEEFKKQMIEDNKNKLNIATIFSYGANEEEIGGIIDDENTEDTSKLSQSSREFLENAIMDYNKMFGTSFDTSSEKFQNYYKDIALRMKNKEIDLLIVVNMFLTGFDATTLNTLWVDKNLENHGLIQAFSRTNRILNSIKTFGNIVCFRNIQKNVNDAIALFGNKEARGIVLMKKFKDYYDGYEKEDGNYEIGYKELMEQLFEKFPLKNQIIEEKKQRDFIILFGKILKVKNILDSFDEFEEDKKLISERDLQDYLGKYQDLRDEWNEKYKKGESTSILDDVVFEIELIKQIEINIDYILMCMKEYYDNKDEEVLITIEKTINSSPELRSKKQLIKNFLEQTNSSNDFINHWNNYVIEEREKELKQIIKDENLKENETRKFLDNAFRDGEINILGTSISDIMPSVSRFSADDKRSKKKEIIINKMKKFFEKYFGIGGLKSFLKDKDN